jgi:protein TonB
VTLVRFPFWPSLLVAGALHAAAAAWIATRPAPRLQAKRPPTTVRLVSRERPAPPPEAARPTTPPPLVSARPTAVRTRPLETPPPTPPSPPPPGTPPPQPRRFAVSIDAVTTGAVGVAVPTTGGATAARGDPEAPSSARVGDNGPFAARAGDVTDVEEPPRLLRQPTALDLRRYYPEQARVEGVEANVRVELLVDVSGAVREVRLVEEGAPGFADAAQQLGRLLAFSPARRGGRAVPVRYLWTFKFRLDG